MSSQKLGSKSKVSQGQGHRSRCATVDIMGSALQQRAANPITSVCVSAIGSHVRILRGCGWSAFNLLRQWEISNDIHVPHCCSSKASWQSASPSHLCMRSIHLVLLHWNSFKPQPEMKKILCKVFLDTWWGILWFLLHAVWTNNPVHCTL